VSRLDFGTFVNRWLEEHAKHRCTPKKLERYTQLSRYALRHLGNIDLQALRQSRSRTHSTLSKILEGAKTKCIQLVGRFRGELSATLAFWCTIHWRQP
jgi:hypothetical protein